MKYSMLIIILLCLSLTVCSCGNGNNIETDSIDQPNQMSNNDQNGEIVMPHGGERPLLTFESVKEYSDYINSKKLPDNFLTYEKISQLGAFNGFVILSDARVNDYSSYLYNLIDSSGYEIFLYVDYLVAKDTVVSTDPITNINVNDLRTTTVKTNGTFTTDGITYRYVDGKLLSISWVNDGISLKVCGSSMLSDYPNTQATVVGKLLNATVAVQAVGEIFAPVDK